MGSLFIKGGIVLPKPTRVARTKIRNLYEDGYPGAASRRGQYPEQPTIVARVTASPWSFPGNGYEITTSTTSERDVGTPVADHEFDMIDRSRNNGGYHPPGPVTGLLGDGAGQDDLCPDDSDGGGDSDGWSPDDCE